MNGRTTSAAYEDFAARRLVLSSEMLSLIPLSRGKEMYALLPFPMMKILFNLVAKVCPRASLTWTTSKDPG